MRLNRVNVHNEAILKSVRSVTASELSDARSHHLHRLQRETESCFLLTVCSVLKVRVQFCGKYSANRAVENFVPRRDLCDGGTDLTIKQLEMMSNGEEIDSKSQNVLAVAGAIDTGRLTAISIPTFCAVNHLSKSF